VQTDLPVWIFIFGGLDHLTLSLVGALTVPSRPMLVGVAYICKQDLALQSPNSITICYAMISFSSRVQRHVACLGSVFIHGVTQLDHQSARDQGASPESTPT
jgi:hypothetical protein